MRRTSLAAAAALTTFLVLVAGAPARAETVPAEWQTHQVKFRYSGFTTQYTCDGIRNSVRRLLRAVGARNDLKIRVSCGGPPSTEIQLFHRMILAFSVPVPAAEGGVPGETFDAEWRRVQLKRGSPSNLDWGECELVEQFRDQVLVPIFNPRDMEDHTRCTPKKINIGSPNLSMTLLMPLEDPVGADEEEEEMEEQPADDAGEGVDT